MYYSFTLFQDFIFIATFDTIKNYNYKHFIKFNNNKCKRTLPNGDTKDPNVRTYLQYGKHSSAIKTSSSTTIIIYFLLQLKLSFGEGNILELPWVKSSVYSTKFKTPSDRHC